MKRSIRFLLGSVVLIILGLAAWWSLPNLVGRLPNAVQQHLPDEVRAFVSTPLPSALPAPDIIVQKTPAPGGSAVTVPLIPTLRPTETATTTLVPTHSLEQTALPSATPTPSVTPLPAQVVVDGLVIDAQGFNNCGPANLSIVLAHHGHIVDQDVIAEVVRPAYEDKNVSPIEMAAYVNDHTPLRAIPLWGGDLSLLKQLIAADFPVIIEEGLLPSEWEGWMGHYLTLYGYDDSSQTFMSMDSYLGPWDSSGRPAAYADLVENWQHFNNVLLVIYPPEREAALFTILGEARLDPVSMWQQVTQQAQTAVSNHPENAFAWFNLGSSLTHLGELTGEAAYYESAVAAFDQARTLGLPWRMLWYQFEPYAAYLENGRYQDIITLANATINSGGLFMEEAYLYRGHAMRALGKEGQANLDYARVIEINPTGQSAAEAAKAQE
ncbi:MAG: C39 family peptidase [Anaerolineae bacterium]|nr:C39 family peptidase [Anaerolineae bacterium]